MATRDTTIYKADDTNQIIRVAGVAFLLNLILAAIKAVLAVYTGSLAISASAIDSGTDEVVSLVIFGGIRLSARKTRTFPLGLCKLENVASVIISLFIFIAGYRGAPPFQREWSYQSSFRGSPLLCHTAHSQG